MAKKKKDLVTAEFQGSILVDGGLTKEDREAYKSSFDKSRKAFEPIVERIRSARRLGKDDLAIRINARG